MKAVMFRRTEEELVLRTVFGVLAGRHVALEVSVLGVGRVAGDGIGVVFVVVIVFVFVVRGSRGVTFT